MKQQIVVGAITHRMVNNKTIKTMRLRTAVCPHCQRTIFEGAIETAFGSILLDIHPSVACEIQVNTLGWREAMTDHTELCEGGGQQPEYIYPLLDS